MKNKSNVSNEVALAFKIKRTIRKKNNIKKAIKPKRATKK